MSNLEFDEHQYWSDRLTEAYSLDGVGWKGLGEAYNRWMYWVRRHVFARTARTALPQLSGLEVLDIGSGTGFYVDLWHGLGVERVTASDLTEIAVDRVQARFRSDRVVHLDITESIRDGELGLFDAISAMDVLFHVTDDAAYARAIDNIATLLRPGGTLLFSENLLHGPPERAQHQVSRNIDWVQGRLRDAGLQVVARTPMFVLMNTPIDSRSRLLHRWWQYLTSTLHRWPRLAPLAGMALSVVELALTRALREGPSTELVVCRKVASPTGAAR